MTIHPKKVRSVQITFEDGSQETHLPDKDVALQVYDNYLRDGEKVVESWEEFTLTWREGTIRRDSN